MSRMGTSIASSWRRATPSGPARSSARGRIRTAGRTTSPSCSRPSPRNRARRTNDPLGGQGGPWMRRIYFLAAIALAQLLVGVVMTYDAAAPVRESGDVFVAAGNFHHFEFGLLGQGRLSGSVWELQNRSFDVFVFDDLGYLSFLAGAGGGSPPPPPPRTHGPTGAGPAGAELRVPLALVVSGLRTNQTILAIVVLTGGLALIGATLMLSVWAWRKGAPVPQPKPHPADGAFDPSPDPLGASVDPLNAPHEPRDDDTRIY